MKLCDFNYSYPKELIAQHPLKERDASRMMVVDRVKKTWRHSFIKELQSLLQPGDLLVLNNSRVLPWRLFGELHGKLIEILLVECSNQQKDIWKCLTKKAKRIEEGEKIFFGMSAQATVTGHEGIHLLLHFAPGHRQRAIERKGVPPLPPYIERKGREAYSDEDRERYQTIYAEVEGSAAVPTAGLHFSITLLEEIKKCGVDIAPVTLHVGIDTFRPLQTETIEDHQMHGERFFIPEETVQKIKKAKAEGRRIIACGTTTVRALESSWKEGELHAGEQTTQLFIAPGFEFHVIDGLLTNFHQPKSTLIMMVSAFAGREFLFSCYEEAIRERYRLFSYGDCMLIV